MFTELYIIWRKNTGSKVEHGNKSDHGHLLLVRRQLSKILKQGKDKAKNFISKNLP